MPLHEEVFIQVNFQKRASKRCFYRDHLQISASVSQHQHCRWNRHWHQLLQKIIFVFRMFFFLGRIFIFFLVLSYDISTILLEIIISLGFPFHPFKGVHCCSRKRLFELSEAHVHQWFEKITAPKIFAYFAYFSAKPSRVELCLSAFAGPPGNFPKSSLEQLFCRDPDSLWFCKKKLHIRRYLRNFPEFLKHARSC